MIRNLIFDLGGVLLNDDVEADPRALAEAGLPEYARWPEFPELGEIANRYLNGLMSDVRVWSVARGEDEIVADTTTEYSKGGEVSVKTFAFAAEELSALKARNANP